MAKIELNSYDLFIKTASTGDEVVNIRPQLAFDKDFIEEMRGLGVKNATKKDPDTDEVL